MIYAGVDHPSGRDFNVNEWVVPGGGAGLLRMSDVDGSLRACQIRNGVATPGISNPVSYNRPHTARTFTIPFEVSGEIFLHSRLDDPFILGENRTPTWVWGINFHPVFVDEDNNIVTGARPGYDRWSASGQIDKVYGIPYASRFTAPIEHLEMLGRWHSWRMEVPAVGEHLVYWDDELVYRVVERNPPAAWWGRPMHAGLRLDFYDYSLRNLSPGDTVTYANYAPRVNVHPDRYGAKKNVANLWLVLHTSEGGETTGSAEALASYMTQPGDRPNGSGGVYGSSYHAVFDTDQVIPCVPEDVVAYSAGGGNAQGIHGCFPGKANQTRDQWLDANSRAMIRQCAAWLCDMSKKHGIPIDRKISVAEMQAYLKGLADHYTVSLAFKKSTHTDVGPGFPWDVLARDVLELLEPAPPLPPPPPPLPTKDVSMFIFIVTNAPTSTVAETWLLSNGTMLAHIVDGNAAEVYKALDIPKYRSRSADETIGVIRSSRTTNDCPPEWKGTGWEQAWLKQRI